MGLGLDSAHTHTDTHTLALKAITHTHTHNTHTRHTHTRPLTRRALARKNGYQLAYNQEIVGLGLANFAGAMFSSYTTTGSFSRSAVNNASGVRARAPGASGGAFLAVPAARAAPRACRRRRDLTPAPRPPALRPPGAKTQLAGFVTSIVVMFVLLFMTPGGCLWW